MNVNIREYIKNNFKGSKPSDIEESINSSIDSKDEVVLPGLGVLFEILWQNSEEKFKDNILEILVNHL